MKVKAIMCQTCDDVVYSRTEGDYRECSCGAVNTDGGQRYTKYGTFRNAPAKKIIINVDTTAIALYNDWKEMLDIYGLIKGADTPRIQQHIIC